MNGSDTELSAQLLATLAARGVADSVALQAALQRSQPTVSRVLAGAASQLVVLGAGRSTRYALPKSILGQAAQQPLFAVHEDGRVEHWGRLSFIHGQRLHVQAPGIDVLVQGRLPWFLAPLRAEGYIGRQQARELQAWGLPANPEQWTLEQTLFSALRTRDAPGALILGEGMGDSPDSANAADAPDPPKPRAASRTSTPAVEAATWDTLADTTAASGPAGSSAGGEQAKFLTHSLQDGTPLLVKFSPPRHTPFGTRWHDLLHAEALALAVLKEYGVVVAECRIVETPRRTFLASRRFDRHGPHGRSHVVPLHAVHDAFVPGPRQHWAATCEALVRQRRLPAEAAAQARALLHFGRLIGNNDMHFGNLSLRVALADLASGRFILAPVYDMLPMRWRPDSHSGELALLPFTPEVMDLQSAARPVAVQFWQRAANATAFSADFRALAATMAQRLVA
jgi:HipA-like C-terminal domain